MSVLKRGGMPLALLLASTVAAAHVKWFVDYDTTKPPLPISAVMSSRLFWVLLALSSVVILLTSMLDRRLPDIGTLPSTRAGLARLEASVPKIMRYGVSLFFLVLGFVYPNIILTPELICGNPYLRYVHLIIALTAFHRRTSFIAGIGIVGLYAYAVDLYGIFHMLDYIVFIGTGVYLIYETLGRGENGGAKRNNAIELVRFTLCSCLAWGAIEKFAHPQLFFDLLTDHPYIAMGLSWTLVVMAAGFVEFCCAYHIYTGRTAAYAGAGLLAFFFLIAVIPFGFIDLVGHFLFIVPLVAIVLTPREFPLELPSIGNTVLFLGGLAVYFALAYGSYYVTHHYVLP